MSGDQPVQVSPRQRRLLRAILPAGVILLVLWIVGGTRARVRRGVEAWWWGSQIPGLITSIILIATGYHYRRILSR